ncbi:hypothetical protein, unlikely [Trypanosoma congolense IL3000]|uniref:Uncharacterized protein n=1 Tax=Trypanosoma congolense (strain IL3000) TaxID=1068625 RepID=F9WHP3_TRYCI|nr:hypothetical protein, unlikely [Trypanosoma congolense IL3000]
MVKVVWVWTGWGEIYPRVSIAVNNKIHKTKISIEKTAFFFIVRINDQSSHPTPAKKRKCIDAHHASRHSSVGLRLGERSHHPLTPLGEDYFPPTSQWMVTTACTLVQDDGLHWNPLPLHSCCDVSLSDVIPDLMVSNMCRASAGPP